MTYGRRKRESHEKSMGSYETFAWFDAISIARLLDELVGARKARTLYESIEPQSIIDFENNNQGFIADFIQKSENQRPSYLNRITKGVTEDAKEDTIVTLLVLSIIGCIRAKEVMSLRDNYRYYLTPGKGNRVTTSSMYSFAGEVKGLFNYDWPWEVFDADLIDDESYDDEDNDEEYA